MRGILIGSVASMVLWTALAWCAGCACDWFGIELISPSYAALVAALACIVSAAFWALAWVAYVCEVEDEEDVEMWPGLC